MFHIVEMVPKPFLIDDDVKHKDHCYDGTFLRGLSIVRTSYSIDLILLEFVSLLTVLAESLPVVPCLENLLFASDVASSRD